MLELLPIFYFPSTVVCIDDDVDFLTMLEANLSSANRVKTFESPKDFLKFIENCQFPLSQTSIIRNLIQHKHNLNINNTIVDLDIRMLNKLAHQQAKYNEISVAIIDYNMPFMNGIELCKKLKYTNFKKILLTGDLNDKKVIEAFNEKIIDCFLLKSAFSAISELKNQIATLEKLYFYYLTSGIRAHLEIYHPLPLSDPIFVKFFNSWASRHNIKEYYLLDKNGSLLLINDKNQKYRFVVHTDRSLNDFIRIHKDDIRLQSYLASITQREKIPFLEKSVITKEISPTAWSKCLYKPNVIEGKEVYYWFIKQEIE